MVCIEFSRITGTQQDFLQEFKELKNCIDDDIDADTEDSDKEYNPDSVDQSGQDQEMKSSDDLEEVKHQQKFYATKAIALLVPNTSYSLFKSPAES